MQKLAKYMESDCCKELLQVSALIYTIKRLNVMDVAYGKLFYILVLSPALLRRALCFTDLISQQYRKLLVAFSYPECDFKKTDIYRSCYSVHHNEKDCKTAFFHNWKKTVLRALKMYSQFYFLKAFLIILLSAVRKKRFEKVKYLTKRIMVSACVSTCRSTLNISLQSFIQRILLCTAAHYSIAMTPIKLYGVSILGSLPVLIEKDTRVHQFNNFVLSHILVGKWKKERNTHKKLEIFPALSFLLCILIDKGCIQMGNAGVSLFTSISY